MKNYVLALLPFLLLISCSDEFSTVGTDDRTATMRSSSFNETDERCDVFYSFTTEESTTTESIGKSFEDYCQVDLLVVNEASFTKQAISICYGDRNTSCMVVDELESRNGRRTSPQPDAIKRTEYCEGVTTFTTYDGETQSMTTTMDKAMFSMMIQNFIQTDEQRDSTIQTMIYEAEQEGAEIIEDEYSVAITQKLPNGETIRTVIDKENNVILYTETFDKDGKLIRRSTFEYLCFNGFIVPDFISTIRVVTTKVCDDRYLEKNLVKFSDYTIDIK